jgi:hypothetical protein
VTEAEGDDEDEEADDAAEAEVDAADNDKEEDEDDEDDEDEKDALPAGKENVTAASEGLSGDCIALAPGPRVAGSARPRRPVKAPSRRTRRVVRARTSCGASGPHWRASVEGAASDVEEGAEAVPSAAFSSDAGEDEEAAAESV